MQKQSQLGGQPGERIQLVLDRMSQSMDKSIQNFRTDLSKLRTGRANPALVDLVAVEYHGSSLPLKQVANVTTPDAKTIQIVPWEPGILVAIERAILAANLGLTPQNDGRVVRISLPPMTEERRKDLVKILKKLAEETKVAIRNHRRDSNEELKKMEKNKELSSDDVKKTLERVQKKTDDKIHEVETIALHKEKEVLTV